MSFIKKFASKMYGNMSQTSKFELARTRLTYNDKMAPHE